MECRKVRALTTSTEFVPGYGQVHFDVDSEDESKSHPMMPVGVIARLVEEQKIADDVEVELLQLDHDGDGEAGGSTAPEPSEALSELRRHYKEVVGKNPFPGWDAEELQRRIEVAADDDGGAPA